MWLLLFALLLVLIFLVTGGLMYVALPVLVLVGIVVFLPVRR